LSSKVEHGLRQEDGNETCPVEAAPLSFWSKILLVVKEQNKGLTVGLRISKLNPGAKFGQKLKELMKLRSSVMTADVHPTIRVFIVVISE
jgi:hypothetical protein